MFPPDASTARRSQTTGHLVVTMPKLSAKLCFQWKTSNKNFSKNLNLGNAVDKTEKNSTKTDVKQTSQKLEVFGNEHTEKKLTKEKLPNKWNWKTSGNRIFGWSSYTTSDVKLFNWIKFRYQSLKTLKKLKELEIMYQKCNLYLYFFI